VANVAQIISEGLDKCCGLLLKERLAECLRRLAPAQRNYNPIIRRDIKDKMIIIWRNILPNLLIRVMFIGQGRKQTKGDSKMKKTLESFVVVLIAVSPCLALVARIF
jgi:hypothetical protein